MTAALSQSGQRTPCGQRCWRTRSKHLASSSSAERLTNSDTAMMTASSSNQDEILGPSNRMSPATATPPAITTPKPDKSHLGNAGGRYSEPTPWPGQQHSILLTVPPLAVVFLKPDRKRHQALESAAAHRAQHHNG